MDEERHEFGGYLPLELSGGEEYYHGDNVIPLNSARNGIVYSVMAEKYETVYLPFYMCKSVLEALDKHDIKYKSYHLDEEFNPINVDLKHKECIVYPNYYGLFPTKKIDGIVQKFENVVLDNTQAFFAPPNMHVYNVYSCRKFVGVLDGAYVIKEKIKHIDLKTDRSYSRAGYLLKCIEQGTNAAYADSLQAEDDLSGSTVLGMSRLTRRLLESVDYGLIRQKRIDNFDYINENLELPGSGNVKRPTECVPMVYPFWCDKEKLREQMVANHIYVPQWWKYLLGGSEINSFERKLIECLFPLPIDQRYGLEDMKKLVTRLKRILNS